MNKKYWTEKMYQQSITPTIFWRFIEYKPASWWQRKKNVASYYWNRVVRAWGVLRGDE